MRRLAGDQRANVGWIDQLVVIRQDDRHEHRHRVTQIRAPAAPLALDSSCWLKFFADTDGAELLTQDSHFEGLPGVRFFAKP